MDTKVGIGVAILRNFPDNITRVLLGKRKGSHGEGEWAFTGGKMEPLESFDETALREIAEEVGPDLEIENLRVCSVINLTEYAPKHYLDIGMTAKWVGGEAVVMEPHKCSEWRWFDIDELPSPLFATVEWTIDASINPNLFKYRTAVVYDKFEV